jgi:3-deoxy-D-manno-octulosonic-acid transferase
MLYRINKGKEDLTRLKERLGVATKKRTAPIIWVHAASVGETMIALNLIENLSSQHPEHKFLLTTGTVTSANIVLKRGLANVIHQYNPIDVSWCVKKFLNSWQPEVGIFIESELWPNLIHLSASKFSLILVNAKMSDKSYRKWQNCKPLIESIFNKFSVILTQSQGDYSKFKALGATNIANLGNLKFSNFKPVFDYVAFEKLSAEIENRKVLLAASTHEGDDEFITSCYKALKKKYQDLLLIIAPRHPKRSHQIARMLTANQLRLSTRTQNQPIDSTTDVYLADTLGELGLFYAVSNVSFIGGSLRNGGHNIIEPSFFKTLIIFGPDMSNFIEIANEYIDKKAALSFKNMDQAIKIIDDFFQNPEAISEYHATGIEIVKAKKQILCNYLDHISALVKNV